VLPWPPEIKVNILSVSCPDDQPDDQRYVYPLRACAYTFGQSNYDRSIALPRVIAE
jgi:hypothetical protein